MVPKEIGFNQSKTASVFLVLLNHILLVVLHLRSLSWNEISWSPPYFFKRHAQFYAIISPASQFVIRRQLNIDPRSGSSPRLNKLEHTMIYTIVYIQMNADYAR